MTFISSLKGLTLVTIGFVAVLSSCARNISSDTYHDRTMGEATTTYKGVIVNARGVTVAPEKLEENMLGAGIGGVAGGILGNQFGGGKGNIATTAAGAIAGAFGGALLQNELNTQNALEYVVKLENGQMRTIVQGPNPTFAAGQRVFVMVAYSGRSRIIPDTTGF